MFEHSENEFNRRVKIVGTSLAFPDRLGKTGVTVGIMFNDIKPMYAIKFDDESPVCFAYEEDFEFLNPDFE